VFVGGTMVFTASFNFTAPEMSWGYDLSAPAFFVLPNLTRLLFVFYICLAMSFFKVSKRKEGSVRPGSPSDKSSNSLDDMRSPRIGSQISSASPKVTAADLAPLDPAGL
jgi:hypothetical protein